MSGPRGGLVLEGCLVSGGSDLGAGGVATLVPTATAAGGTHPTGMHSSSNH